MTVKYSKDGKVSFNAFTHAYLFAGKRLTGVTTLINRYKNKFDSEAVATAYALKNGLQKEEVMAEWAEKGRVSLENGTAVHNVFEDYIKKRQINLTGRYPKEVVALRFIQEIFETGRLTPVEAEMIVYDQIAGIASQIDCLAMDRQRNYYILDWKTNSSISRDGWGKIMKQPFGIYPDASFYHYSIQVNFYKRLCKEYPISGAYIVHIDFEDYTLMKAEDMPEVDLFFQKDGQAIGIEQLKIF